VALIDDIPLAMLPLLIEAWHRYDELRAVPVPSKAELVTVDQQMARESARIALELIYEYAVGAPAARAHGRAGR
jgi:hypothetical protein